MARQLRLEFPGALYHLTARGNAREAIYRDDVDRKLFLALLGREIEQQGWQCYAYCLMDNHYHLLIETPELNLSRGMRRLNQVYTQAYNRRHGRVGHVLQGRFKSIVVDKDPYLLELSRYIVFNPVRAGMTTSVRAWPWSSYRATAGLVSPPAWLQVTAVLQLFDSNVSEAQRAYRKFVADGKGKGSPWEQLRGQIFLGDDAFLDRMDRLLQGRPLDNVPRCQSHPARLDKETILEGVGRVYELTVGDILARQHPEAYQIAAWLLRRKANLPLGEVAELFGVSASRISHIQRLIEGRQASARELDVITFCNTKQ